MNVRKIVGLNLKRIRVEQNITQERLALEAVIDRAYVGRIERGLENVTLDRLETLAGVLKVPVSALFEAVQRKTPVDGLRAGRKPMKKPR
ncbi:helix-turn-helix domain-containing protein [Aestuariivirga litoralis]|uniref:helix-turn-helix domain-containing protein n=1 Tax=Aestuariivirga litoralis TaxID=2650924 RepID=UPI0018C71F9E|nr:helix-turn-helix transcriptional regulator [Aestuariivirga litoralis]MBG1233489.1 helix-turn-helix transcriptional regulator [Aestuariivirga litoralis]